MSFPSSLDSLTNPASSDQLASVSVPHATQHANANDILEALEAKVGTGASTPTAATVLLGTGTGTSAWGGVTQYAFATLTSAKTTTSGSYADVDATNAAVTLTTTGGAVLLLWSGFIKISSGATSIQLTLGLDGSDGNVLAQSSETAGGMAALVSLSVPAAGAHTWKLRFRTQDGASTATVDGSVANGWLIAVEFKR